MLLTLLSLSSWSSSSTHTGANNNRPHREQDACCCISSVDMWMQEITIPVLPLQVYAGNRTDWHICFVIGALYRLYLTVQSLLHLLLRTTNVYTFLIDLRKELNSDHGRSWWQGIDTFTDLKTMNQQTQSGYFSSFKQFNILFMITFLLTSML